MAMISLPDRNFVLGKMGHVGSGRASSTPFQRAPTTGFTHICRVYTSHAQWVGARWNGVEEARPTRTEPYRFTFHIHWLGQV
jgi:hypothetical protein